ncbi:hypothetical protein NL676_029854 [Syzygium grande]|nr:hypothetical protein NL676_029854 [Syzygium grande]
MKGEGESIGIESFKSSEASTFGGQPDAYDYIERIRCGKRERVRKRKGKPWLPSCSVTSLGFSPQERVTRQ